MGSDVEENESRISADREIRDYEPYSDFESRQENEVKKKSTPLIDSLRKYKIDMDEVKNRIDDALQKSSIDERDGKRCTALYHAAALQKSTIKANFYPNHEAKAICVLLLDAGADVNASAAASENHPHDTPLTQACFWGKADIVELLLQRGADNSEEARYWAVYWDNLDTISVLDKYMSSKKQFPTCCRSTDEKYMK